MVVYGLFRCLTDGGVYQVVDMQEAANDFRRRNAGEPVIAVDGLDCAWYLYNNLDSLRGGQYKEFRKKCECFVRRFHTMGFRLSFFFRGLPMKEKSTRWMKRKSDNVKRLSRFFAKLRAAQSEGVGNIWKLYNYLPAGVVPCATVTFKQLGCQVRLSTADCNMQLAHFAARNECCIGVLANDIDILMSSGVPCLYTFKNMQERHNVTTWCFRPADIASHFDIEVADLPIFATFLGNEIVGKEFLQEPHRKLRQLYGEKPVPELAVELLKSSQGDLRKMCEIAFGDNGTEGLELVEKSVFSYKREVGVPVTAEIVSKWDAVLQHVEAKHVSCEIPGYVLTVMKCRLIRGGFVLEDLSVARPDYPPTGLVVRGMLARIYTVLLWDSDPEPCQVTEYIATGSGDELPETVDVQKSLPEGIHHPGLLELWSGSEDCRWRIFTWVMSPTRDLSALRSLSPQYLVVPAAALHYLYHDARVLTLDEVRVFVIVAVSVQNYSTQTLSDLRGNILKERAIYLATLFVRTVLHVLDGAAACGLSFPQPADCHLDAYFDGKLFHHIYSQSRHTTDIRALKIWGDSQEKTLNLLMNIIL